MFYVNVKRKVSVLTVEILFFQNFSRLRLGYLVGFLIVRLDTREENWTNLNRRGLEIRDRSNHHLQNSWMEPTASRRHQER